MTESRPPHSQCNATHTHTHTHSPTPSCVTSVPPLVASRARRLPLRFRSLERTSCDRVRLLSLILPFKINAGRLLGTLAIRVD
jgi:hypothetical protein